MTSTIEELTDSQIPTLICAMTRSKSTVVQPPPLSGNSESSPEAPATNILTAESASSEMLCSSKTLVESPLKYAD